MITKSRFQQNGDLMPIRPIPAVFDPNIPLLPEREFWPDKKSAAFSKLVSRRKKIKSIKL